MWRQAQMWWRFRNDLKQCGVKMWRQTQMWRQGEMWRQTMWHQNVVSDTSLTKQFSMKCVFKKVFSGRRKCDTPNAFAQFFYLIYCS